MRILNALVAIPATILMVAPAFAAQYLTVEQAQRSIFPDADRFVPARLNLTKAQKAQISKRAGVAQRWDQQEIWRVEKNGRLLGYFIVDSVIGKHEFITYGVGLTTNGHVRSMEVLIYNETRGGEVRNASWRAKLAGKSLADPFVLDKDVPNISGATLSCKNLMMGVKRLLVMQELFLPKA